MSHIDAIQRERCECGAEYEVGSAFMGPDTPPNPIRKWRINHGRGCDLMYACLAAADREEARRETE